MNKHHTIAVFLFLSTFILIVSSIFHPKPVYSFAAAILTMLWPYFAYLGQKKRDKDTSEILKEKIKKYSEIKAKYKKDQAPEESEDVNYHYNPAKEKPA